MFAAKHHGELEEVDFINTQPLGIPFRNQYQLQLFNGKLPFCYYLSETLSIEC